MIGHGVDERSMRIQVFLNLGLDFIQLWPKGFPNLFHRIQGFDGRIVRHGRDTMECAVDCQGQLGSSNARKILKNTGDTLEVECLKCNQLP